MPLFEVTVKGCGIRLVVANGEAVGFILSASHLLRAAVSRIGDPPSLKRTVVTGSYGSQAAVLLSWRCKLCRG